MSVKKLKEEIAENNVLFGIKQALKHGKKLKMVFVAKDTRDGRLKNLKPQKLNSMF